LAIIGCVDWNSVGDVVVVSKCMIGSTKYKIRYLFNYWQEMDNLEEISFGNYLI
jgi:hypothetical protein